ncbi:MAG TPA: hypothetical protein VG815_17930 [Chloroflexota bacterium]|jgi:hypothetical protein|nr:hypothetical protein [Chloroflexota bacterium]
MGKKENLRILARCVVCKGDIFEADAFETWEGGYYCQRHSLAYLNARAEEYRRIMSDEEAKAHSA